MKNADFIGPWRRILLNMDGVICISLSRALDLLSGTSGKVTPDKLKVVLEENLRAKQSALLTDYGNTSNRVKRIEARGLNVI